MHIAMIGSGYVGLVSGACLADFGHKVTCVDKDQEKISALNRGAVPIFEPGLNDLIANNMRGERLTFTSELTAAVAAADAMAIPIFHMFTRPPERSPLHLMASPSLLPSQPSQ
jgi:UDPglucose 6-dehydrogenase